jgi:hypothetical protein
MKESLYSKLFNLFQLDSYFRLGALGEKAAPALTSSSIFTMFFWDGLESTSRLCLLRGTGADR